MTIQHAILGFLSWKPLTGYELKKLIAESPFLPWSGNNNQIYRTLVDLHRDGLVMAEVQLQDSRPSRKIYTITDKGQLALRQCVLSSPEPPQYRSTFLIQLAWTDQLEADELDELLEKYEEALELQLSMARTEKQRNKHQPQRTPREIYLWQMIAESHIAFYESDLRWVRKLRRDLSSM